MNYLSLSASMAFILFVILSSCNHDNGTETHTHGDETHAPHDPELEPLSFTKWTNKSELFVEFPPLIVGHQSRFAAHFSDMVSFKAINKGKVVVRLMKDNKMLQNMVFHPLLHQEYLDQF